MVVRFIRSLFSGKRPEFYPDLPMLRECNHCQRFVVRGMCNRLTVHLIDHHKMAEDHAYSTVHWVFERVREHRKNR